MKLIRIAVGTLLGGTMLLPVVSNAQSLYIDPPHQHIAHRPYNGVETLTLNLIVDGGIANAVAWGTSITLADTTTLQFVTDFGGTGKPFKSSQPYFDTDLSDPFVANSNTLSLNFANFSPGTKFNRNGLVTLGQFQVQVLKEPNYPNDSNFGGLLSVLGLDVPPFGTAVQDDMGNNLLHYAFGATITSRPPTPEPSAWMMLLSGVAVGGLFFHRRVRNQATTA